MCKERLFSKIQLVLVMVFIVGLLVIAPLVGAKDMAASAAISSYVYQAVLCSFLLVALVALIRVLHKKWQGLLFVMLMVSLFLFTSVAFEARTMPSANYLWAVLCVHFLVYSFFLVLILLKNVVYKSKQSDNSYNDKQMLNDPPAKWPKWFMTDSSRKQGIAHEKENGCDY